MTTYSSKEIINYYYNKKYLQIYLLYMVRDTCHLPPHRNNLVSSRKTEDQPTPKMKKDTNARAAQIVPSWKKYRNI